MFNKIIFFAAKDGEALYSQQKQDQELTVAQIMKESRENHYTIQVTPKSDPLWLYSGREK